MWRETPSLALANGSRRAIKEKPLRNNNTHLSPYASSAKGVRDVPDMLAAAQLSLRPLARGETAPESAEGRRIVGDACDLLRDALANLVEVTRNGYPFDGPGEPKEHSNENRDRLPDPRMSPRAEDSVARSLEQCALTHPFGSSARDTPHVTTRLSLEQLDRLRRCANGNTLRFESSDIVEALVSGGYATEGPGCVVTVTPKGHQYLLNHPA